MQDPEKGFRFAEATMREMLANNEIMFGMVQFPEDLDESLKQADSSFSNSPAKTNVGEIFRMLAPDTRIKVIMECQTAAATARQFAVRTTVAQYRQESGYEDCQREYNSGDACCKCQGSLCIGISWSA